MSNSEYPWAVRSNAGLEEDLKNWAVDHMIADLHRIRAEEKQHEQLEMIEDVMKVRDKDPDIGFHYVTTTPDGKKTINKMIFEKASDQLHQLLQRPDPAFLVTGLSWSSMAIDARIEMATLGGLSSDVVLMDDICQVFSEDTDQWLIGWQQAINTGEVWNANYSTGAKANALIEAGFLLLPATRTVGNWHDSMSRHDARPGSPGTAAFVRSQMGDTYLAWIEAVR